MSTDCTQRNNDKISAASRQLSAKRVLPLLVLAALVGCSDADKRKWQSRTPEQNFSTALESKSGDLRRDAVVRIGESSYWASADAFHVLDAVSRTDPVPQVRCIAIRILARYADDRPVKPLIAILTAEGPGGDALPGNDDVRWETSKALVEMQHKGFLSADQQSAMCELFIKFLRNDKSRNVRIVSTQALGQFKDKRVLAPLVQSLRNSDYMIADSAERSLMALTGQTHAYDADAWSKWIEQTPDPFANAGAPVASSQPAGPSWWDQQQRLFRRAIKLSID